MATSREAGELAYQKSIISPEPMDPSAAAERLRDVKRILDQHSAVFFLLSGTCLGAIREQRFIPWDDEMDVGSVIGLHGLTEETIERVIVAFTDSRVLCPHRPYIPPRRCISGEVVNQSGLDLLPHHR